jgi:UDP-N-acetylmuramate: L-alanyl-gamma-D-glutamyl-meso-diaminopimelate ligase
MRMGAHAPSLARSLERADLCFVYARPDLHWNAKVALGTLGARLHVHEEFDGLVAALTSALRPGDRVLAMSNGDFGGIHHKLLAALVKP